MKAFNFHWRINQQIKAPKVRVLSAEGKQIGVMTTSEALAEAGKLGLDLIEIAPTAEPPVAKIIELGKFRYEEEKKAKKAKGKTQASELKEVRLSPFIADNDYGNRLEKIKEFLGQKNKVKVVVVFKGRQMGSKQYGMNLLRRVNADLGSAIAVDMPPKFLGRFLTTIISPLNKPVEKVEKVTQVEKDNTDQHAETKDEKLNH